jgi:hypothetical protein
MGGKGSKLKIIIKTPQSHAAGQDDAVEDGSNGDEIASELFTQMTEEQGFTAEELSMPLEKLHRLCRAQVRWSEAEGEELQKECKAWEDLYKEELLQKNTLIKQVLQNEVDWHDRRQAILSGAADVQISGVKGGKAAEKEYTNGGLKRRDNGAQPLTNGRDTAEEAMEE